MNVIELGDASINDFYGKCPMQQFPFLRHKPALLKQQFELFAVHTHCTAFRNRCHRHETPTQLATNIHDAMEMESEATNCSYVEWAKNTTTRPYAIRCKAQSTNVLNHWILLVFNVSKKNSTRCFSHVHGNKK